MRIIIASDAWRPQVNGVVRTLETTTDLLRAAGHEVALLTPDRFRTLPCPSYPEIRLALWPTRGVARALGGEGFDAVHIATEGPIGWATRRWCMARNIAFTTSFHTRFPDYVAMRTPLRAEWVWPLIRRFHSPAKRVFAATPSLAAELQSRGLYATHSWPRGVDTRLFSPRTKPHPRLAALPRPIQLYVGRVSVEKNVEEFLRSRVEGSRVIVGDGPARDALERRYPDAIFVGTLQGERLAAAYAAADVFVFPSRSDTFGLVNVEALASGVPVAALPAPGPLDIIGLDGRGCHGGSARIGALDDDLDQAIRLALTADRDACVIEALHYNWDRCTDRFLAGLVTHSLRKPVRGDPPTLGDAAGESPPLALV